MDKIKRYSTCSISFSSSVFFEGKESLVKNFLTDLFRNLTVEVLLSSDIDSVFELNNPDLCAETNVRIANSIFTNHERARLDMEKPDEDISKKNGFFDDDDDDDHDDNNNNFPDDVSIKQESDFPDDVSIKQESDNESDDKETIPYASPNRESDNEIEEKIYYEPKL